MERKFNPEFDWKKFRLLTKKFVGEMGKKCRYPENPVGKKLANEIIKLKQFDPKTYEKLVRYFTGIEDAYLDVWSEAKK